MSSRSHTAYVKPCDAYNRDSPEDSSSVGKGRMLREGFLLVFNGDIINIITVYTLYTFRVYDMLI